LWERTRGGQPMRTTLVLGCWLLSTAALAQESGQPLASNVSRLLQALEFLGQPLPGLALSELQAAIQAEDAGSIHRLLDPHVLAVVGINPESRVRVERGRGHVVLQQAGFTAALVKVQNSGAVKAGLVIQSPQAGRST
jgi:hypothetical protein